MFKRKKFNIAEIERKLFHQSQKKILPIFTVQNSGDSVNEKRFMPYCLHHSTHHFYCVAVHEKSLRPYGIRSVDDFYCTAVQAKMNYGAEDNNSISFMSNGFCNEKDKKQSYCKYCRDLQYFDECLSDCGF